MSSSDARFSSVSSDTPLPALYEKTIITVDGPTAAGKGTASKTLAKLLDFAHLDTGLLYRIVAKRVLENGLPLQQILEMEEAQRHSLIKAACAAANALTLDAVISSPELRTEKVSSAASMVAQLPEVRAALLEAQRQLPKHLPASVQGIVVDGRDIGTTVFPCAPVKFYVTASVEERTQRRFKELQQRGELCTFQDVLSDLIQRDERDTTRAVSPLKPAQDAVIVDTTGKSPASVVASMLDVVHKVLGKSRPGHSLNS